MLDYIIWNAQPEIIEGFRVRWYGLLFAVGFFVSYTFLGKIFKKEGLQQKELDSFTFMTFILLIVGLRLGHCLFYEPDEYLKNPIRILFVWEGGLASHGGAIGLLLSFYLFTRKSTKSFVWIASRAAVVIPFTAACVRLGNLMNSEIYGVATHLPWGFVYLRDAVIFTTPESLADILLQSKLIATNMQEQLHQFLMLNAQVFTKGIPYTELQHSLVQAGFVAQEKIDVLPHILLQAQLLHPSHPTQIYEALVYLSIFGILMWYYFSRSAKQQVISSYLILGIAFIGIFGSRFCIEFIKNNQVAFEQGMQLNMGQWLSIPFILAGVFFIYVYTKQRKTNTIS
ncbi:MAG TPA: prolipoprotein diacylglyceryl transferase [Bacteroidales bacterium]|jgi:prolipoprotein diacylglyceryl transferase|nr:prolipoprotein diacylglyceryl transferase [Bacteroidales bacterium]